MKAMHRQFSTRARNSRVRRFVVGIIIVLAWCQPSARAAELPGKWLEVRSPNFIVVSNAGRKTAMETAKHFEQIRALFIQTMPGRIAESRQPLRVFALDGEKTMKQFLPSYWERKGGVRPSGVFRTIPTGTQVVTRGDFLKDGYYGTVYHEYYHFLVHQTGLKVPLWLNEGLATYWGSTRLNKKVAEVGHPEDGRLRLLRSGQMLQLGDLMSIERSSAHYSRSTDAQWFYAQSWLLTHYLLIGDRSGEGRKQLIDYLRRIDLGEPSREAAAQAFGDLEDLRSRLKSYLRKPYLQFVKLAPPEPVAEKQLELRQLSRAEAAALAALYLVESRRTQGVAELVATALEGAPERVESHVAAGLLNAWNSEYPKAEEAFARAVALPEADSLAHYGFAVLRFYNDRSPEGLATVRQHLERAIALNVDFAPARVRLAEVLRRTDGCSQDALAQVRSARALVPRHIPYRLKEGQLLLECGEAEAAQAIVRSVVDEAADSEDSSEHNTICWQGSLRGLAREVLPACDRGVELRPESYALLDSRGVARAITGDLKGAADDLRAALQLGAQDGWEEQFTAVRSDWVRSLEAGENPLDGDGLARLREDPEEVGLEWWQ